MGREVKVEGAISGHRCKCGPDRMAYTDAEGPRCLKCGDPITPQLSRMTRAWLVQRVAEERAKRAASA